LDDALSATRAAVEEGIVPGGGVAYLRALKALDHVKPDNDDEKAGVMIVKQALETPLRQIVLNAGLDDNDILMKVKAGKNDYGFNAKTEQYENLLKSGIIDPTKVARLALEYGASVAMSMLTTECVIVTKREKEKPQPMMPDMM
jgi:chaperonin GroEL